VIGSPPSRRVKSFLGCRVRLLATSALAASRIRWVLRHPMVAAAPRIDRLVVVADDGDIAVMSREQGDEAILGGVDVLVFVDQHVFEALLVLAPRGGVALEQIDRAHDQIVEVERVGLGQPALVFLIDVAEALAQKRRLLLEVGFGPEQSVLRLADLCQASARRDLALVVIEIVEDLLDDLALIAVVDDHETGRDADARTVAPQNPHAHGVKRADPEIARRRTHHAFQARLHLGCGFVGEGHRQNAIRGDPHIAEQIGDTVRQDARLAASRTREN
jgi:hypothetical protein